MLGSAVAARVDREYAPRMAIAQAMEFRGGSHDGVRREPQVEPDGRFPETLWRISWDDGEQYARTEEEFVDEGGRRRVVFRHDPHGDLLAQARRAYSGLPA